MDSQKKSGFLRMYVRSGLAADETQAFTAQSRYSPQGSWSNGCCLSFQSHHTLVARMIYEIVGSLAHLLVVVRNEVVSSIVVKEGFLFWRP